MTKKNPKEHMVLEETLSKKHIVLEETLSEKHVTLEEALRAFFDHNLKPGMAYCDNDKKNGMHKCIDEIEGTLVYQDGTSEAEFYMFADVYRTSNNKYYVNMIINYSIDSGTERMKIQINNIQLSQLIFVII